MKKEGLKEVDNQKKKKQCHWHEYAMGSFLPSEKLDRNNPTSWKYKMAWSIVRQEYLDYLGKYGKNIHD